MKLRNKILAFVAPIATIAAIAPIALTSCNSPTQSNSVSYTGEKKQTISTKTLSLNFTLTKALSSGETIKTSFSKTVGGTKITDTQVSGTTITVSLDFSSSTKTVETFTLCFSCYNATSSITPIWTSNIGEFEITHP